MPVATGNLRVGGRSYNAQGEAIEAAGALRLTLASLTRPTSLPDDDRVVYADGFHADVAGDVATINLHEAPVLSQAPAEAAGLAALGVAAAAAIAYYWPLLAFHAAALAAPLYTRLRQPEILDNGVRNRIYDIICANPGISARAVHRESAQSWGTVVYHLRQLERHHLVVSRTLGRTRNYYENHGKYRGMEVQLACLQAPRALALARVVLEHPGVTQEELVAASGFPQPTTSYYVRKLRKAGLVDEAREGRYVRYVPAADLARFVETAESGLAVGAPHASGINA
jgi:predicted transcriptional regulator